MKERENGQKTVTGGSSCRGVREGKLHPLPVQVEGADDAHLSEEGKQEGQQGNSSDGQERPALPQPRFRLVKHSGVTQTEFLWKVRRWTGVGTPPSRWPGT